MADAQELDILAASYETTEERCRRLQAEVARLREQVSGLEARLGTEVSEKDAEIARLKHVLSLHTRTYEVKGA